MQALEKGQRRESDRKMVGTHIHPCDTERVTMPSLRQLWAWMGCRENAVNTHPRLMNWICFNVLFVRFSMPFLLLLA